MARVAITAPPAMTAMSQIGRATFSLTCDFLSPLSMIGGWEGDGVVLGSTVVETTSVEGFCVVLLYGLVLFGVICNQRLVRFEIDYTNWLFVINSSNIGNSN